MSKDKVVIIACEGCDFAGKDTQIPRIVSLFESLGKKCLVVREPGGEPTAEIIRNFAVNPDKHNLTTESQLFLFLAARAQLFSRKISILAKTYDVIILNRTGYSTHVYQGIVGDLSIDLIKLANQVCYGEFRPDLCIVLDITIQTFISRRDEHHIKSDRESNDMDRKEIDFYIHVIEGYKSLANEYPEVVVVDANGSENEVAQIVTEVVHNRIVSKMVTVS